MQEAFDTVDHEILLAKLVYYGFRGLSNEWFRSYLTRRQQFIHIGGKNSEKEEDVKHGVPRIIPLLFLICISDPHALPEVAIKPILENICYFFPGAHREVCWFAEHIPILQEG